MRAAGSGSGGWPQPPRQGLSTSRRGVMLGSWYPSGLPWEWGTALLFDGQRDQVEKGKFPGGEDVQRQKTGLGFEGKGRKFSSFSCTSFSPPSRASSN